MINQHIMNVFNNLIFLDFLYDFYHSLNSEFQTKKDVPKATSDTYCRVRASGVGGGVQWVYVHPKKLWFVENPGKIPENPGKIRENLG